VNVYRIGICPHCQNIIDAGDDGTDTFMVHGPANYSRARDLLRGGMPLKKVKSLFCGYCGNYNHGLSDGCGCDNPYPQA